MFTGLIQTMGTMHWVSESSLYVQCPGVRGGMALGDSIAVDGLCLTVAALRPDGFVADVSPETLDRSTLRQRRAHYPVNVEGSLRAGDKIGGHFVRGHEEAVGVRTDSQETAEAWTLSFRVPLTAGRYIVSKGSVAINGVSLTIADLQDGGCWFQVAVIPTTYRETNLSQLQMGDPVNVEADILGKYVEKLLGLSSAPASASISLDFLVEHGYA